MTASEPVARFPVERALRSFGRALVPARPRRQRTLPPRPRVRQPWAGVHRRPCCNRAGRRRRRAGERSRDCDSLADALAKITKAADLSDVRGVETFRTALDALGQRGRPTGQQIRDALAGALKSQDLATFETLARAAFDSSEQAARRLAATFDAFATESLPRAGNSIDELGTGFDRAATSAIQGARRCGPADRRPSDRSASSLGRTRPQRRLYDQTTKGPDPAVRPLLQRWWAL